MFFFSLKGKVITGQRPGTVVDLANMARSLSYECCPIRSILWS